jgi:hypothetical protein
MYSHSFYLHFATCLVKCTDSFHFIFHDILVGYEKLIRSDFTIFYFEMINPSNIVKIFGDRASKLLSPVFSTTSGVTCTTVTKREHEVADLLYNVLESIVNSHSHSVEVETTLDHGSDEREIISDTEDRNDTDCSFDADYLGEEEADDTTLSEKFSLEYMTRAVDFYDEINPKTGQRKRRWSTVKHHFKRIPHQTYIARFRHYLEKHGTKKQKVDKIDDYVFDMFERARQNCLPVHEIDLRRWAMKKAMDESLHNFVASRHWLHTFEHKHDIVSRKITKVKLCIAYHRKYI